MVSGLLRFKSPEEVRGCTASVCLPFMGSEGKKADFIKAEEPFDFQQLPEILRFRELSTGHPVDLVLIHFNMQFLWVTVFRTKKEPGGNFFKLLVRLVCRIRIVLSTG